MNWNQLSVFHAVAEEGSIGRGAMRLHVSQPAVSKQVRLLEEALGVALFERTPRGVRPTEAGALLAGYAGRLFALEREAEQAMADYRGVARGELAVGASTSIGDYVLPPAFAAFHERFPGVTLKLEIANTEAIQARLLNGELDLGLTEGFVDDPNLDARAFMQDEMTAIVAPDHPLAGAGPTPLARLCAEPFIMREAGSGSRAVIERALAERGLAVTPAMTLGSTDAIKRSVAAGAGVAIVSALTIGLEVEMGRLAIVPLADAAIRRPLHLLRVKGKRLVPAARAFLALLSDHLARRPSGR